jgi:hypothetical protein
VAIVQALALLGAEQRRPCDARETVTMKRKRPRRIPTVCPKGSTNIVHRHIALLGFTFWTFLIKIERMGIVHRSLGRSHLSGCWGFGTSGTGSGR